MTKTTKPKIAAAAAGKRASLPLALTPELATLVEAPPTRGQWIYEVKFDGYRILARIDGDDVRLFTRNGNDWTAKLKALAAELKGLHLSSAWLDGEIVVMGPGGVPSFQLLQNAFDEARTADIRYYLFDMPFHDGLDLRQVPLRERRERLQTVVRAAPLPHVLFSDDFDVDVEHMLQTACRLHLEGVIGKRADSPYVSKRSPDWIKLKCTKRQEFVIVGFTEPKGARTGIGSLMLAVHDEQGHLRYAGNVGTGFDTKTLSRLRAALDERRADKTALHEPPPDAVRQGKGHWVKPTLVAEVSFAQWTGDGRIRHSVFHGLRDDKPAQVITKEVARGAAEPARRRASASQKAATGVDLRITHPDRIVDEKSGATKKDVVDYYLSVARALLPHLQGRPLALVRAPGGIGGELFFQKHAQQLKIPGLTLLDPTLDPGKPSMVQVDTVEALIGAAQMNVLEFHTWNAHSRKVEQPDRIVFDLDPGEGVAWSQVREAAELTRTMLEELGLASFLKTSGGKGLHVVVPIAPKDDWDSVKAFSKAVVEHLAAVVPARFVAKSGPKNRVGKIFIDYLRNGRGATTACAFSLRARPGLGVSVPCTWQELPTLKAGDQWNWKNVHERVEADIDPWAGYARLRQTLARPRKKLGL